MLQLIEQDNMFWGRQQNLKEEVSYCAGPPGQLKDKEAMYEVDIPTDTKELGTDQYDSEDSSDMFPGPATGDFVILQGDLSKLWRTQGTLTICLEIHVYQISHSITSAIVNKFPTEVDGEAIEPSFFRWVETQYLGLLKVKAIEDSSSDQEDEKQTSSSWKRVDINCIRGSKMSRKVC